MVRVRIFYLLAWSFLIPATLYGQSNLLWQRCLGGDSTDYATAIIKTSDGGFIMAGGTYSPLSDGILNHGGGDAWIVKLSASGDIQWQKVYGGSKEDVANAIIQTADGGYAFAGLTWSNDGDVSGNHGTMDAWIVKLDDTGALQWQHCIGGKSYDGVQSIIQTSDGGYAIVGGTSSSDADASSNHGGQDVFLVKLDQTGKILWSKCYGGSEDESAGSIIELTNQDLVIAGATASTDADLISKNPGIWILRVDHTGSIRWQDTFPGSYGYCLTPTIEGGFAAAGYGSSWVAKFSDQNELIWRRSFGDASGIPRSILQNLDGSFTIAGHSTSTDIPGHHGSNPNDDAYVVKLSNVGELEWQKDFGGSGTDFANSILQTNDGKIIIAGGTYSSDGDVLGNHNYGDAWIAEIGSTEKVEVKANNSRSIVLQPNFPNPASLQTTISFSLAQASVVSITITDATGRQTSLITSKEMETGSHEVKWDASSHPAGAYTYLLKVGDERTTGNLTVVH